jgi:hypothetical protein
MGLQSCADLRAARNEIQPDYLYLYSAMMKVPAQVKP